MSQILSCDGCSVTILCYVKLNILGLVHFLCIEKLETNKLWGNLITNDEWQDRADIRDNTNSLCVILAGCGHVHVLRLNIND